MVYYDSNNNEYTVTSGVLSVTKGTNGTGIIPDCSPFGNIIDTLGIPDTITSIHLDSTITAVGVCAFNNTYDVWPLIHLNEVTMESVTSIGDLGFGNCDNLASVFVRNSTPATLGDFSIFPSTTTLYVPYGTGSAYRTAWTAYADQIVESPPPMKHVKYNGVELQVEGALRDGSGRIITSTYEPTANKVTSVSPSSTDTEYPSAKCLYTGLSAKAGIADTSTTSTTNTWSCSKLNSVIGDIETALQAIRGV